MFKYLGKLLSDGTDPSFMRHAGFVVLPDVLFCITWATITKNNEIILPLAGIIGAIFAMKALQTKYEKKIDEEK